MSEKSHDRLVAICARLASPFDGERANAAALASKLLDELGLTWSELVSRGLRQRHDLCDPEPSHPVLRPGSHVSVCEFMWANCFNDMSTWERGFVGSLLSHYRKSQLSAKQVAKLDALLKKFNIPKTL